MALTLAVFAYVYQLGAPPLSVPETTVMYSADGSILAEQHQGQNRHWISLEEMGQSVIDATLAIEDRKFYSHHGFDVLRIGRAAATNVLAGSKLQGASTITQQYARNLYLSHEKTWVRKFNEALYSMRLEMHYTKDEILEGYLNTIYYGHSTYGIQAASAMYFNKDAGDLTTAEAAMLAGIPKGPGLYSPKINPEQAEARQQLVLRAMRDNGSLTMREYEAAVKEKIVLYEADDLETGRQAPYFQDAVQTWLENELGISPAVVHTGGLQIHTTLDRDLQRLAEHWIKEELNSPYDLQVGFVSMDPNNGHVKAMVGGRDYGESPFNRATQARRQAGSTFKPFLYYAALKEGFRPNTLLTSEETDFVWDDGRETYKPKNFNDRYADEPMTMLQALAVSDNIYAMKTHFLLGFQTLADTARTFGITSPLRPVPSLALGSVEVGVTELTNAYSPFANGGREVEPAFVTKVVDRNGEVLYSADPEPVHERVLDPALAFLMTDMMHGMFEMELNDPRTRTAVTGQSLIHLINRPVAGKSGSTPRDSWMIGFTPQLVTGVWVGVDKDARSGSSQAAIPDSGSWGMHSKRIWAQFMSHAHEGELILPFSKPPNVSAVEINPLNGMLATDDCPVTRETYFLTGTEPTAFCTEHVPKPEPVIPGDPLHDEPRRLLDRIFRWFD
ncbi:monofunctional biosynthetic peptidoglycan transglycosylase [Alteribacter lacisalsi]|uniref:Monofunctional biosynthetic peptidoglycan transglycosylase n=2 Tax=Alteribacter lacisalsi TaxID=2045244 RepID=A0A2W0HHA8_9BACI|nr:monofunctional biosynthetic peptidoglycan transglycosylase [Alteribacter lacisalsi]